MGLKIRFAWETWTTAAIGGYAPDYVRGMHAMLQQPEPRDLVLATGATHSVKEFVDNVFSIAGLDAEEHVLIDGAFYRPNEVNKLRGDPSRAAEVLGWQATTPFEILVRRMVEADLEQAKAADQLFEPAPTASVGA